FSYDIDITIRPSDDGIEYATYRLPNVTVAPNTRIFWAHDGEGGRIERSTPRVALIVTPPAGPGISRATPESIVRNDPAAGVWPRISLTKPPFPDVLIDSTQMSFAARTR